ncbi:MAG: C-GCAxxG-C-C family protein [Eubacteriales bacterium]|nr:C-GCAxxG-C-C family protein [Eubacteriales bacterium]
MEKQDKAQQALAYFNSGSSCAQSVFTAFYEEMGLTEPQALKLSSSLGGGVSGLREVCGAFLGMSMVIGALQGFDYPGNQEAKERQYALIQQKAEAFKAEHGTLICRDLLLANGITPSSKPAKRTDQYYADRPCAAYVALCARMAQEALDKAK